MRRDTLDTKPKSSSQETYNPNFFNEILDYLKQNWNEEGVERDNQLGIQRFLIPPNPSHKENETYIKITQENLPTVLGINTGLNLEKIFNAHNVVIDQVFEEIKEYILSKNELSTLCEVQKDFDNQALTSKDKIEIIERILQCASKLKKSSDQAQRILGDEIFDQIMRIQMSGSKKILDHINESSDEDYKLDPRIWKEAVSKAYSVEHSIISQIEEIEKIDFNEELSNSGKFKMAISFIISWVREFISNNPNLEISLSEKLNSTLGVNLESIKIQVKNKIKENLGDTVFVDNTTEYEPLSDIPEDLFLLLSQSRFSNESRRQFECHRRFFISMITYQILEYFRRNDVTKAKDMIMQKLKSNLWYTNGENTHSTSLKKQKLFMDSSKTRFSSKPKKGFVRVKNIPTRRIEISNGEVINILFEDRIKSKGSMATKVLRNEKIEDVYGQNFGIILDKPLSEYKTQEEQEKIRQRHIDVAKEIVRSLGIENQVNIDRVECFLFDEDIEKEENEIRKEKVRNKMARGIRGIKFVFKYKNQDIGPDEIPVEIQILPLETLINYKSRDHKFNHKSYTLNRIRNMRKMFSPNSEYPQIPHFRSRQVAENRHRPKTDRAIEDTRFSISKLKKKK